MTEFQRLKGMAGSRVLRPPIPSRALIRVASWIVPARARAEWRARWDNNLWNWWILFERGELTARDHADLLRYSWGSFTDAFWIRFSREHLFHSSKGPGVVVGAAVAALLALAVVTGGFDGARGLFERAPLKDPGALVSIKYTGAANEPFGIPPRWIPLWKSQSKLLAGLAGYVHARHHPRAAVTTDFFSVIGVAPALGRLFRPEDEATVVLSHAAWQGLGGDPKTVGRTLDLDGRPYKIIGVLPEGLWAISPGIDAYTPLPLEPQPPPGTPDLIGVVGRLKPRASEDALRRELFDIAKSTNRLLPRPPMITEFKGVPDGPGGYLMWMGFALVIGGFLVWISVPRLTGSGWKYWSYLGAKTALSVAIPTLLWLEASALIRGRLADTPPLSGTAIAASSLAYLVVCACAIWWSFADQRRRCPICLYPLSMPVTFGSWSSVLDPATTEMMCDSGHGSLSVPEATEGAPDRWTNLDPSWRDLFRSSR